MPRLSLSLLPPVVLASSLLLVVLGTPGCPSRGGSTPQKTFALAQTYIRNGKYGRVFSLYTDSYRQKVLNGYRTNQEYVRGLREGRESYAPTIQRQYELTLEGFLAKTPRELHERVMRIQRELSLRYEIVGEPRMEGKHAVLMIRGSPEMPAFPWEFLEVPGQGWLIDDVPTRP